MAARTNSSQVKQKVKSQVAAKVDAIREIQQCRIKVQTFEKEKNVHVYNKHSDFYSEFSQLQEIETKAERERKTERIKLEQQLSKIKLQVKKFRKELRDVKPTPEFLETIKAIMEEVESQISNFKEQQREQYENLMKEERLATQEVNAVEKRIESWSQLAPAIPSSKPGKPAVDLASARDITKDLPAEVAAFEKFMAEHGGIRGGWDDYDHSTFLKFRNRHKGKLTFIRELISHLPTKTEDEIRQHENWFHEYLNLNDVKKEAIQRWKEKKEVEKETAVAHAGKEDGEEAALQKQKEARERAMELERQRRKQHLNAWKVDKELLKAEEEERKLRQELEKAKEQESERKRQLVIKRKVEEFRKQREEEDRQRQLEDIFIAEAEKEERRLLAQQEIVRFQERDIASTKEKRSQLIAKQEEEEERRRKLEKLRKQVAVTAQRDPSRLLKPTAGWVERQKDTTPSGGGPLLHMPHKAVPSWRQGLH